MIIETKSSKKIIRMIAVRRARALKEAVKMLNISAGSEANRIMDETRMRNAKLFTDGKLHNSAQIATSTFLFLVQFNKKRRDLAASQCFDTIQKLFRERRNMSFSCVVIMNIVRSRLVHSAAFVTVDS